MFLMEDLTPAHSEGYASSETDEIHGGHSALTTSLGLDIVYQYQHE